MSLLEALAKHGLELKDKRREKNPDTGKVEFRDIVIGRGLTRQQLAVIGFEKRDLERAVRSGLVKRTYVRTMQLETFYYVEPEAT